MDYVKETKSLYEKNLSIKTIARTLGISETKVKKILISESLYEDELSLKVCELQEKGLSLDEISNILQKSRSCINRRMKYSKCVYNSETPSNNALKIRRSRNKSRKDDNCAED